MDEVHACECPEDAISSPISNLIGYEPEEEKARAHAAGKCPGDYKVMLYDRRGKHLWLCSCCILIGDMLVPIG